jgi:hypothetical protein
MNEIVKDVLTPQGPVKKKGNASWKPREAVNVDGAKDKNFRYRMVAADDYRIATLVEQGWELCSALNGERTFKGANAAARIIDGTSLDSVVGDRDRVMMRLPLEEAAKRDAHYENKAKTQVKGVKNFAENVAGAKLKGEVKISGKNVAEITD